MFNVDWNKLIVDLLPVKKRGQTVQLFIQALIRPLVSLYDQFLEFRNNTLLEATYNSQVLSLQTYLRELFGVESITISDADEWVAVMVYNKREGVNLPYLYNTDETPEEEDQDTYFFNTEEDNSFSLDFVVTAPLVIQSSEPQLKAAINKYKFMDKQYKIVYI